MGPAHTSPMRWASPGFGALEAHLDHTVSGQRKHDRPQALSLTERGILERKEPMYVDRTTTRVRIWQARRSAGLRQFWRFTNCVLLCILAVTLVVAVFAAWALASMGAAAALMTVLAG